MNNPNPFVPKGSLLEQQSLRRSRLKIVVGCVVAVSCLSLMVMLIQGCKRDQPVDTGSNLPPDSSLTNGSGMTPVDNSSNPAPVAGMSNAAPYTPTVSVPPPTPVPTPAPVPTPTVTEPTAAGSEYTIVQGDTLAKIAKAQGVSLKALEAANPGVDPKKLKIKQKLVIPAATTSTAAPTANATATGATATTDSGGATYTVKSGDTLTKIAHNNGITVKALRAANNLTTDHIKVNQKLVIPAKAEAAATVAPATEAAAPAMTPAPAPTPAPAAAPVPSH